MYDLPRWFSSKWQACNAGDVGSLHGSERSPGEGNSCLGHPMDRGTCIHGGHKEAVRRDLSTKHEHIYISTSIEWWCHPTISSSVIPYSSCLQSFPASRYFLVRWLFTSGGQSIGVSALTSVLLMNIQDWFPLGWTGLILQSKGLWSVFSNTTVQKHQFISTQLSGN